MTIVRRTNNRLRMETFKREGEGVDSEAPAFSTEDPLGTTLALKLLER